MSEEKQKKAPKPREPKKNSIPMSSIEALVADLPQHEKESWRMIGHRKGVRIALPKTLGISRAYFYGLGDYALIPEAEGIIVVPEERRREQRRGGIMAEVDFSKGPEVALAALRSLIEVVRAAPAPQPKLAKPKKLKEPVEPKATDEA